MGLNEIFNYLLREYFVYFHLIGVPLSYLLGNKKGTQLRDKLMAIYFESCSTGHQPLLLKLKAKAYGHLKSITNTPSNPVRLLELGAGTGNNFMYYPDNTKLSVVDPNVAFQDHLRQNVKEFPGIKIEKLYGCPAEEMHEIEDNSMDAVVTSDVLCSVTDIPRVLQEIHRVLKPGGAYYFAEHCLDHQPSRIQSIQSFLTKYGIWPFYFCGCEFRDMKKAFAGSPFEDDDVHAECGYNEMPENRHWADFRLCSPHFFGKAVKK